MTLTELERKMEQAGETVGSCLRRIRDGSLYLEGGYDSFEGYCEQRWNYSRSHAYRLIDHSKVVQRLKGNGHCCPSEGQLRPAMALKRHYQTEDAFIDSVVNVVEIAEDRAGGLTARSIQAVVESLGYSRPNQDIKPVEREFRQALNKLRRTVMMKKYKPEQLLRRYPDCVTDTMREVCDYLMACLEVDE